MCSDITWNSASKLSCCPWCSFVEVIIKVSEVSIHCFQTTERIFITCNSPQHISFSVWLMVESKIGSFFVTSFLLVSKLSFDPNKTIFDVVFYSVLVKETVIFYWGFKCRLWFGCRQKACRELQKLLTQSYDGIFKIFLAYISDCFYFLSVTLYNICRWSVFLCVTFHKSVMIFAVKFAKFLEEFLWFDFDLVIYA